MESKMLKTACKYQQCLSEKEELITSVRRPTPSVIASATSSTSSVASTRPLIPITPVKPKKPGLYLTTREKMTQKEKNILMMGAQPQLGNDDKKLATSPEECTSETQNKRAILKQGLAAFSVSLCSLVVGFASAYTSPALVSMEHEDSRLHVTDQEKSWIGSLMPLSALVGGAIGGPLIEFLGRKTTIMATALPFVLSFLLISFAVNVPMIMVGRAVAGLAVGVSSLVLPVYLGETLQPEVRGMFGLFPTTIGNFGILLCFAVGKYLDWTGLALFGALLALPYFILMFFVPETPRWFVGKGKTKRARKALHWLRGEDADVSDELNDLEKTNQVDDGTSSSLRDLFQRRYVVPLAISMGLMFFQQMSGINAIIFYTVAIFKDAGSTIDSNLSTIIVGVVNLASTLIATFLIDRLGRKILMYISNTLMALTLTTLGTFFYFKANGADVSQIGWIPLASFVIFVIGFSVGAGPIPWLMMGEILPSKIRGNAASLATAFNWTCTFIVTKTFNDMNKLLGAHGTFWAFGFISLVGLFFVIFFVPETQGKSLEDIERNFMGEKIPVRNARRHSSIANLKPLPSAM